MGITMVKHANSHKNENGHHPVIKSIVDCVMVPTNNLERQIEMLWNYEPISELEVEALCAKVRRKGMYRRSTHMLPSTETYTENHTDLKELPEMG
ncbi:hypothetical protein RvY_08125 [Ramazzottius varieornatus]|uniref:Uncharacterized protein n=1 Tax=Ramazzottius varieornatus TaxID=947166 RepID=A0A1D1V4P3_RAMVA|nr:hypothetical protein RvY_08125 [Ramazzottius varieornatus]